MTSRKARVSILLMLIVIASAIAPGQMAPSANAATPFTIVKKVDSLGQILGSDSVSRRTYSVEGRTVNVLDSDSLAKIATFTLSFDPYALGVNSTTHRLYFTSYPPLSFYLLHTLGPDGAELAPVLNLQAGPGPVVVDEVSNRIFILTNTYTANARIDQVDGTSSTLTRTFYLEYGDHVTGAAIDSATDTLFVSTRGGQSVVVAISATSGEFRYARDINYSGFGLQFNPLTRTIFVPHSSDSRVSVYSAADLAPIVEISLPFSPGAFALDSTTGIAYVAPDRINTAPQVVVIDGNTNAILASVRTARVESTHLDMATHQLRVWEEGGSTAVISGLGAELLPPTTPVYRFWSSTLRSHFYTASSAERDQILARYPTAVWALEGTAYQAFAKSGPGTVPLYRFWSLKLGGHFFTTDILERDHVIAAYDDFTWAYEGIAYYVLPSDTGIAGSTQVSRFWSDALGHHFYTADPAERDYVRAHYPRNVWSYEKEAYAVLAG